VSNFKSFDKDFILNLTEASGYDFNKDCIRNGTVNNAIIYGHNGVGKSNLALAIFDIIEHLTDKKINDFAYLNYRNAYNTSNVVDFYYEFLIDSRIVTYEYKKADYKTLVYERFSVDGEEQVLFDRTMGQYFTAKIEGVETLKKEINNNELSVLKYIKNNAALDNTIKNTVFLKFFEFIERMLFFRSLQQDRMFLGFENKSRLYVWKEIIEKGNVQDFEKFLNIAGIDCKLAIEEELDKKDIVFDFNGKKLPFEQIASTGTIAIAVFYYWYQSIREKSIVSFLFIDEFDAFYHHELSRLVVEKLKETGVQFVLTTHNTSILTNDLLRPDCYFLMNKQTISPLSKCTHKELREAHNIEKMYKARTFNVD